MGCHDCDVVTPSSPNQGCLPVGRLRRAWRKVWPLAVLTSKIVWWRHEISIQGLILVQIFAFVLSTSTSLADETYTAQYVLLASYDLTPSPSLENACRNTALFDRPRCPWGSH